MDTKIRKLVCSLFCSCLLLVLAAPTAVQASEKSDQSKQSKDRKAEMERSQRDLVRSAERMKKAGISLDKVVRTAEKASNGQAISARLTRPTKEMNFKVLCLTDENRLKVVTVDGVENKAIDQAAVTHAGPPRGGDAAWVVGVARYTVLRLVKHSKLTDTTITNRAGEELGEIEQLAIDPHSGRVIYAAVAFDEAWELGDKLFAVPLPALRVHGEDNIKLNVTRKEMVVAEGFDEDKWPRRANWRWAADLDTLTDSDYELVAHEGRYGVKWRGKTLPEPTDVQRSEQLIGMTVRNDSGKELGTIEDFYVDPERSRVSYAILAHGGTLGMGEERIAVPWDSLDYTGDDLMLGVSEQRLKNAPRCTQANHTRQVDPQWVIGLYDYYDVQPHWVELEH